MISHSFNRDASWAQQRLVRWPEMLPAEMSSYVSRETTTHLTTIDVSAVTGTQHPDYGGITWSDLLEKGKRMPANSPLWR